MKNHGVVLLLAAATLLLWLAFDIFRLQHSKVAWTIQAHGLPSQAKYAAWLKQRSAQEYSHHDAVLDSARPHLHSAAAGKWAVFMISSEEQPTASIKQFAALEGWRVVVLAEQPPPVTWEWPNVTVLSLDDQDRLGYSILNYLPANHAARKNVGYLYAIEHGAHAVYDGDAGSTLLQDYLPMLTCSPSLSSEWSSSVTGFPCEGEYTVLDAQKARVLSASNSSVFNPYHLSGQHWLRPRGMPAVGVLGGEELCFTRKAARPLIQQGLIDGRPDVDALRSARFQAGLNQKVSLDKTAFSVVLPPNVMTPVNSHNTLYLQDALWSLLLPVGLTRECRLNALVQALPSLQLTSDNIADRLIEAVSLLEAQGHVQDIDVALVRAWVSDLQQVGYNFPSIHGQHRTLKATAAGATNVTGGGNQVAVETNQSSVNTTSQAPLHAFQEAGSEHSFVFMRQWCMQMDKVLYINFNRAGNFDSYSTIKLLQAMYKPYFRKVVFAGHVGPDPSPGLQQAVSEGLFYPCNSYNREVQPKGFFAHTCLAGFLSSGLWASMTGGEQLGLFYINDDIVFSPCMVPGLNSSRIWYSSNLPPSALVQCKDLQGWHWPSRQGPNGLDLKNSTIAVFRHAHGLMAERVSSRLQGGALCLDFQQGDTFYIPARLLPQFVEMMHQMHAEYVITEAAIPHILFLLRDHDTDMEMVNMVWGWQVTRRCFEERQAELMPSGQGMQAGRLRVAGCFRNTSQPTTSSDALFVVHPVKLSKDSTAAYVVRWWGSQECT